MISLLVVNYRSARLALDAIRSARAATTSPLHVVVVENSVDEREADVLRPHCDFLLTPDKNLGYAGAINAGRPHCRGEVIIVSNPDVVFAAASIDELARALDEHDVAVAGPALYWDDAHEWILPPSDAPTAMSKLDEALASRFAWYARRRDRRRIRERMRFWSLTQTTNVRAISGAVMAIRARDFDALNGFDERFPLYFEENDFLRRVISARKRVVYVPPAKCRHMYNQSAGADNHNAARAYAESEMLFFAKWYGRFLARFLKSIERPRRLPDPPALDAATVVQPGNLIEASPLRTFDTAAGHVATGSRIEIPAEVWETYLATALYVRVIDRRSATIVGVYARHRS